MNFEDLIDKLYNESNLDVRRYIPDKLAKFGNWDSTPHLGKVLLDDTEPIALRIECAESLGKQGDIRSVKYLVEAVSSQYDELRRTIIWSLGQIGHPTAIDTLIAYMNDRNVMVRRWVAKSLGRIRGYNVHDLLIQFAKQIDKDDLHVYSDILRAVVDQISSISPVQRAFWLTEIMRTLKHEEQVHITLSAVQLLQNIIEKGETIPKESMIKLYQIYENNQVIMPYIFVSLGLLGMREILLQNEISAYQIKGLALSKCFEIHKKVLENKSKYNNEILEVVLETIPVIEIDDISEFLVDGNLGVRIASLLLNAKKGGSFDLVQQEINRKLSYGLFSVFEFYPNETIELILHSFDSNDKVLRQTALRTIIKPSFVNQFKDKIKPKLIQVSKFDKVWHIRRDARFYLEDLNF